MNPAAAYAEQEKRCRRSVTMANRRMFDPQLAQAAARCASRTLPHGENSERHARLRGMPPREPKTQREPK
jgi:hypothetical protein